MLHRCIEQQICESYGGQRCLYNELFFNIASILQIKVIEKLYLGVFI